MDLSRVLLDVIYVALEIMDLCVVLTLILRYVTFWRFWCCLGNHGPLCLMLDVDSGDCALQ